MLLFYFRFSSKMLKVHWNNNVPWLVYNVIMHSALVPSALAVYGGLEPHWLRLSVILCAVPPAGMWSKQSHCFLGNY